MECLELPGDNKQRRPCYLLAKSAAGKVHNVKNAPSYFEVVIFSERSHSHIYETFAWKNSEHGILR
jgi:hypothetical protein